MFVKVVSTTAVFVKIEIRCMCSKLSLMQRNAVS